MKEEVLERIPIGLSIFFGYVMAILSNGSPWNILYFGVGLTIGVLISAAFAARWGKP